MNNIEQNLERVKHQIAITTSQCGRDADAVTLLAVSKTKPASDIRLAYRLGQHCFGENYLQEAERKITELSGLDIEWHFIGPIQSNKTRPISELFHWVHSVDRLKIAQRLSDQRPPTLPPLNLLLQVNIDCDPGKSGTDPDSVMDLADQVSGLPNIRLRGLMAIPAIHSDYESQSKPFAAMQALFSKLKSTHADCDTLSMGMSGDMEAAIAHGSTLVRIGTAIFGPRQPRDSL